MKQLRFKTNINCEGCIAKFSPVIEKEDGVKKWSVDIASKDKVLTVETDSLDEAQVKKIVEKAGFKIKE